MSAQITIEAVTYRATLVAIGTLGRTYCGACLSLAPDAEPYEVARHDSTYTDATCDGCGTHRRDWPTTERRAEVVVEHTPCRIF